MPTLKEIVMSGRTLGLGSKAEVLLMDLRQPGEFTDDLFAQSQPVAAERVMTVLDEINGR